MLEVYLAGDGLKKGNQMLRMHEREQLNKIRGIHVFNPWEEGDINDKSKDPTAEAIFAKDTNALLKSDIVIADIDNNSVGTTSEMGQMWGVNYMRKRIVDAFYKTIDIVDINERNQAIVDMLYKVLEEIPYKQVMWQTTDIRDTDIPEFGHRRSHSLNQYLHGMMLDMSGEAKSFEDILEYLERR